MSVLAIGYEEYGDAALVVKTEFPVCDPEDPDCALAVPVAALKAPDAATVPELEVLKELQIVFVVSTLEIEMLPAEAATPR